MPTTASPSEIRDDFDAIARLIPEGDVLGPDEAWLLKNLPVGRGTVLEIGCGVGHLARRLARSFDRVVAIDASEGMITEARRRTIDGAPIEYFCADLFEWLRRFPATYDCIVTAATLHHVDLRAALRDMARALKGGGRLLVSDLFSRTGWRNIPINAVAFVAGRLREARTLRRALSWKLRCAYWRHGRNETYLRLEEVARVTRQELPDAKVRGRLGRYGIVWQKP